MGENIMENEVKPDRFKQLRVLGIIELSAYVVLLAGLLLMPGTIGDIGIVMYALGGLTLVPSALTFVNAPTKRSIEDVVKARNLQKPLFVSVCIAILPSLMGFALGAPAYFVACFAGLFFYITGTSIVNNLVRGEAPLIQPQPQSQPETVSAPAQPAATGKFCDKCGSKLDDSGKCPSCA
jgi:hypothetical protein